MVDNRGEKAVCACRSSGSARCLTLQWSFESDRAFARLGRVDGRVDHVLGAMH
jgi:hypothetical protein